MYTLRWKNPALNANKAADITVQVGAVVSDKTSLRFTGKGAPNYGAIQQENLMRLLESFADSAAPLYPTVGQEWFDTTNNVLKVCSSTSPLIWKSLGGLQVTNIGDAPPSPAALGDLWFQRTGSLSGTFYIYTGMGRYPESYPNVGGWSQVWPQIETIAGREEYDYVLGLVNQLVGPTSVGGNGALGKFLPQLPNLAILDADLFAKFAAKLDSNVVTPVDSGLSELLVDVNSTDWDLLLAAAKYAVSRLDLPAGMIDDISPVPFVSDGRQAPVSLTSLSGSDVRYPSLERRSNRRFGIVTLLRAFTETVNVLNTAVANRYSLKGINGTTGTNPAFASTTEIIPHMTFSSAMAGASTRSFNLRFNFNTPEEMNTFLNSGAAIQITMSHAPGGSPTAADTNLKTLLDSRGVLRATADKTRVFANVFPLSLSIQPIPIGIKGAAGGAVVLTTQGLAGAQYTLSTSFSGPAQFSIALDFASTGAMNGTLALNFEIIRDKSTYLTPASTPVFGSPIAYALGDKSGVGFNETGVVVAPTPVPDPTPVPPTVTQPTWAPPNYGSQATHSADLRTAYFNGDPQGAWVHDATVETISPNTGKWYMEFVVPTLCIQSTMLGIGPSLAQLSFSNGGNAGSNGRVQWNHIGQKRFNGNYTNYGNAWAPGDRVAFVFDSDTGELYAFLNNVSQGLMLNVGTGGTWAFWASGYDHNGSITIPATPFFTPPMGAQVFKKAGT